MVDAPGTTDVPGGSGLTEPPATGSKLAHLVSLSASVPATTQLKCLSVGCASAPLEVGVWPSPNSKLCHLLLSPARD